jgi:hypothetical protein
MRNGESTLLRSKFPVQALKKRFLAGYGWSGTAFFHPLQGLFDELSNGFL